jgi:hypothetical protein
MLSAPPLARALHHHVEIGDPIPAPLYAAVAAVLAYVFQLRHAVDGAPSPRPPADLPVPLDLDPLAVAAMAAAGTDPSPSGSAAPSPAGDAATAPPASDTDGAAAQDVR